MATMRFIIDVLLLLMDTVRLLVPLFAGLRRSQPTRSALRGQKLSNGVPSREIAFLLAATADPELFNAHTSFQPVRLIRKQLWTLHFQLEDLAAHSIATRADYSPETLSAMKRLVGRWGKDALPLLRSLAANPNAHDEIRKAAELWVAVIEKRTQSSTGTPTAPVLAP